MSEGYLLLTPVLVLFVVALVGFVGCDQLFGLDRVPDVENHPPTLLDPVPGNMTVDLAWIPPTDATPTGYRIERGEASNMLTFDREVPASQTTFHDDVSLVNEMTYYYAVTSLDGTSAVGTSEVKPVVVGYTGLTSLVTGITRGTLRNNFMANVGMGFQVGTTAIRVSKIGRYKVPGNSGTHTLKLFDLAANADIPGSSVTINLAGAPDDQFAYADLPAPIPLTAGATYYLLSSETDMGDRWYDSADTKVTTTNVVTRVFAVNEDSPGHFNPAPIAEFVYGPLDVQY
ncbi:MAG TPA: hypothetical protein VF042_01490 [Gemmatimonadaceae bacterium]